MGIMIAVALVSAVALSNWLVAWWQARRSEATAMPASHKLGWLPLVLLVPAFIHISGISYGVLQGREQLLDYPVEPQAGSGFGMLPGAAPTDSIIEHAADEAQFESDSLEAN
jgi:hypothetical protein